MTLFEQMLNALQATMETPGNYGWFHLMSVAIMICVTVFMVMLINKADAKAAAGIAPGGLFAKQWLAKTASKNIPVTGNEFTYRRFIAICWIIIVLFEIYKQLVFSLHVDGDAASWSYQWYAFPYQLCSTPLYVMPFIAFLKPGKIRNALMVFLASFALFGGLAVYVFPNDVYTNMIGINIQTMVHHGIQIITGIVTIAHLYKYLNFKTYLPAVLVFIPILLLALGLDVIGHYYIPGTFNMFYISPWYPCTLPVLSIIYAAVPYPVFLCTYVFGFMVVAGFVCWLFWLLLKLCYTIKEKIADKKASRNE
ncbi:MAG: YwaF family protein [Eggerthellaceae bacterium]|nr:YwaF family protein [Eggerthellaceae bacterium]